MSLLSFLIALIILEQRSKAEFFPECYTKSGLTEDMFDWFYRITKTSKYGSMPDAHEFSYDTAVAWCEERDMQLAKITSLTDYQSINDYLIKQTWTKCEEPRSRWWISGSDAEKEGVWKHPDGSNLTFQMFYAFEPIDSAHDLKEHSNYIVLECSDRSNVQGEKLAYLYRDREFQDLNDPSVFFCQFKESSPCWKNSTETHTNENSTKVGPPEKIGKIGKRTLYVSVKQFPVCLAYTYCIENKMQLLDLEFESKNQADQTYQLLLKYIKDRSLQSLGVSFWVNSNTTNFFTDQKVSFDWEWIDTKWRDKHDTKNLFFSGRLSQMLFGNCLSIGAINSDSTFTLSMAHCEVPHFTICYTT